MRTIARSVLVGALALAACGAQPNQPVLANAPRPNPAAVAGGAAAAAAAITLADPDAASRRPEKNEPAEKKPVEVKENVPADVLDRLDKAEAERAGSGARKPAGSAQDARQPPGSPTTPKPPQDARQPAGSPTTPNPPRDALDFGQP